MAPGPTPAQPAPGRPSPEADAEARWRQAVAIASTTPLPPAAGSGEVHARRDKLASAAVVLVLTATGLVLAYGQRTGAAASDPAAISWTRVGLQLGLVVLGLSLLVTGVVVAVRSGQWQARYSGPLKPLNRTQRREVMRHLHAQQLLPGADAEQVVVLRAVAAGLSRPRGAVLALCGMVVNIAAQAVGAPRMSGLPVLWLISIVLLAVVAWRMLRDQAAAERFLSQPDTALDDVE